MVHLLTTLIVWQRHFPNLTSLGSILVIGDLLIILAAVFIISYLIFGNYSRHRSYEERLFFGFIATASLGCIGFVTLQHTIVSPNSQPIRYAQVSHIAINYRSQVAILATTGGTFHWTIRQHPQVLTNHLTTLVLNRYQNALVRPYTAWRVFR